MRDDLASREAYFTAPATREELLTVLLAVQAMDTRLISFAGALIGDTDRSALALELFADAEQRVELSALAYRLTHAGLDPALDHPA